MQAKLNRFSSHSNMPEMQGFSLIRESHSSSRMIMMFGKSLEKRLMEISLRIKKEKEDLLVAEEQLISLINDADEARIRSLVSETALSDTDRRDSARQSENMEKYCQKIRNEIDRLEEIQDGLLDKLNVENI